MKRSYNKKNTIISILHNIPFEKSWKLYKHLVITFLSKKFFLSHKMCVYFSLNNCKSSYKDWDRYFFMEFKKNNLKTNIDITICHQKLKLDPNWYLYLQVNLKIMDHGKFITTQVCTFTHVTVCKNFLNFSPLNILVCVS